MSGGIFAMTEIVNATVARRLEEVAALLEEQGANPFRIEAYRRAAEVIRRERRSASEILAREGVEGLRKLPRIGEGLSRSIRDLVKTGRLPMLERLRGAADPVALLSSVTGVGRVTADRLHHDLGINTLEELEAAAHDGRLAVVLGLGPKRVAGIMDSLEARLGRLRRGARIPVEPQEEPPVSEVLEVDREYRERAARDDLPRIAPRRMNPARDAWLPVLHTERGARHYTALFSNTPRAHELGKTRDWVVLYYDADGSERQCTVITSERGPLKGKRIVRGREEECARHYAAAS
jgi:DNA polymerase (family X)